MWADSSQKNYTGTLLNLFRGKKKSTKCRKQLLVFFCFIMHAYLHHFLVTRKMELYYQQVFLAILLVLKLLLLSLEYVGSLLNGDVF